MATTMSPTQLPLSELHDALRQGTASAYSVAQEVIAAYADTGKMNGAYRAWNGESTLELAYEIDRILKAGRDTGPLMGIPVAVKDLFGVPGFRTYAGTPTPLPSEWETPGPILQRVLGDLALVTGKTHTVEFAFGGLGTNAHWGTPRNPRDQVHHRVPGGSSSGSGVAIAEGTARLAIATDTSGSVRVPASMTGVVGLKTTAGRWPTSGVVPLSSTLDTVGLLARDVSDLRFSFHCLNSTESSRDPVPCSSVSALCIGVPDRFFWDDCSPGIAETVAHAIQSLARAGATVRPRELPGCEEAFGIFRDGGLAAPELAAFLQTHLPSYRDSLDCNVAIRVQGGETLSAVDYLARRNQLTNLGLQAKAQLDEIDVMVMPTVAITPPMVASIAEPPEYARLNVLALRNTVMANLMGLSAITLPVGKDAAAMPVGMQLLAKPWNDEMLLQIAAAVEAIVGTGPELLATS